MTTNEFTDVYWSQYVLVEKEFTSTLSCVSLSPENKKTFSFAYQKLLLEICSEIDVVIKQYCKILDPTFAGEGITRCYECIKEKDMSFFTQGVQLLNLEYIIYPWKKPEEDDSRFKSPFWWMAYNKVKHCRTSIGEIDGVQQEYYKFANQEYTLYAMAGWYQILVNIYLRLATQEEKKVKTPLPGSRLFELIGGIWDSLHFFGDFALYFDGECLIYETGRIRY